MWADGILPVNGIGLALGLAACPFQGPLGNVRNRADPNGFATMGNDTLKGGLSAPPETVARSTTLQNPSFTWLLRRLPTLASVPAS